MPPLLTLASASPRRRQLLEMLGLEIEVRPSRIPETRGAGETPIAYVERLAREKAHSVPGDLVLGADTTVQLDDTLLEKPADEDDALRMLRLLQGRSHSVITSVALVSRGQVRQATDVTAVTFRPCSDDFLRHYIATGEPMDKAGAYGIQGYGAALVERIDGDFFGVMGLPVRLVLRLLEEAGYPYGFGGGQGGPGGPGRPGGPGGQGGQGGPGGPGGQGGQGGRGGPCGPGGPGGPADQRTGGRN